jgi:N-acyl homoserine lactone hydrolase
MKRSGGLILGFAASAVLSLAFWRMPISAQSAGDPFRAKDTPQAAGFADRLYILDGGVGHAGSAVAWDNMLAPPGTPIDISAYAHLIKHGDTWMMFDTSTNDSIANMPNGFLQGSVNGIRWTKTQAQTMTAQLKLAGITPADIKLIGISHNHADHTGNITIFKNSTVLIQRLDYEQAMDKGGNPQGPPSMPGAVFERNHPVSLLDGDYDVFGDGSVLLFFVGGHTPGSQVCLVHLKDTGYVLLSGDVVFLDDVCVASEAYERRSEAAADRINFSVHRCDYEMISRGWHRVALSPCV